MIRYCFLLIKLSFAVITYIVLTNATFWLIAYNINSYRYWVLLDYLWILPLLFIKNRYTNILFFILFTLIYIVDVLYWIKQFFPIITLQDFFTFLTYLPFAPTTYYYFIIFGIVNLILIIYAISKLQNIFSRKMVIPYCILYIIFQYLFFDFRGVNYSDYSKTQGYWGSMYETYQNLKFDRNLEWRRSTTPNITTSSYESILIKNLNLDNPPEKILFILNESWGYFLIDKKVNEEIIHQIKQLNNVKIINYGKAIAGDGTILAEIKEICSLFSDNLNLKLVNSNKFNSCIPKLLKKKGYETISYHGANASMYDRDLWYSLIGIDKSIFYKNLNNLERCFSFPGACDKNIIQEIAQLNKNNSKQFIYWLTLNSHHPYSEEDINSYYFDCNLPIYTDRQEACRNINLQFQFFKNLSLSIQQGNFRNTTIIIVGDHTPPLLFDKNKDSFEKQHISYLHLKVY